MKPINKKERTKKTIGFIAVFIIALALAIIPFISLVSMPSDINPDEYSLLKKNETFQLDDFSVKLDSLRHLLNSFTALNAESQNIKDDMRFLLNDMKNAIKTDSSAHYSFYFNILTTYEDYMKTKTTHFTSLAELVSCEKELENCKRSLSVSQAGPKKPKDSLN